MGFWIWVMIIVTGLIVVVIIDVKNTSNRQKAMEDHLGRMDNFSASQKVIGVNGVTGLAIDEQRKKICLIGHIQENVAVRVFSYRDLLSSEIFEDGATVTKTVRSSQIGGALIGGLALGGVGAIIGGLSGKTQTSGKINAVALRLTVNDSKNPLHDIYFINFETNKEGWFFIRPSHPTGTSLAWID